MRTEWSASGVAGAGLSAAPFELIEAAFELIEALFEFLDTIDETISRR